MPKIKRDETDLFRRMGALALYRKGGGQLTQQEESDLAKWNGPKGGILDYARGSLLKNGEHGAECWSPSRIWTSASGAASVTSGDLTSALGTSSNRFLLDGYGTGAQSFEPWVRIERANDYRSHSFISMTDISDVEPVLPGQPIPQGSISDRAESGQVTVKGRAISIPREVLINDDLGAVAEIVRQMGESYAYSQERDVYDELFGTAGAGPTMSEDSNSLFDETNHLNVGSAGALSVSRLAELRKLLRNMPAAKGDQAASARPLNLNARWLIVPSSQETLAEQTVKSAHDGTASNSKVVNPFSASGSTPLQVVVSAYLDSLDSGGYYVATDNRLVPSLVLLSLEENARPILRYEDSRVGESLGISMDIHGSYGVLAANWRGITRNAGA